MVKPYLTNEVRWFIPGAMPDAVSGWFLQVLPGHGKRNRARTREDVYLLMPGRNDIGLKFRRNKLQLKLRCDYRPFSALEGRVAGVETDWERHSWAYDNNAYDLALAFSGSSGEGRKVAVSKKRRQKIFDLGPAGDPLPVSPGHKVPAPILVEVTELSFPGFSGWSLGLDVVDPGTVPRGRLRQAAAALLKDFPALPLKQEDSLDYMALLSRWARPSGRRKKSKA